VITRRLAVLMLMVCLASSTACGPAPASTPVSSQPPTSAPIELPAETPTLIPVSPPPLEIIVYFTDSGRYAAGNPPFEVPVIRVVPFNPNPAAAVLTEFFVGPTAEEQAQGLVAITSGFTGYSALDIQDGIARVYLTGTCFSNGATYTVAQPILANLLQFADIQYVKVYDEDGTTEQPTGPTNSIPVCLEP
jgi:hypothetical protein